MLAAFLTTIFFAFSAITARRTSKFFNGIEANFWRLSIATLLLASYAYFFGRGHAGAGFPVFFISGMVGFGLGDIAFFRALPCLGSRLSVLIVHCLAAPVASSLEWFWLGTTLTHRQVVCGLVILAGVAVALAPGRNQMSGTHHHRTGILFALIAAVCQGAGAVISRHGFNVGDLAREPVDGITAAYQRIIGGVLLCGVVLLFVKFRKIIADVACKRMSQSGRTAEKWERAGIWIFLNALCGPALGVSCYQWALKTVPTGIVLPIVALTPLVAIPLARWFEKDKAEPRSIVGGIIAVGGVIALAWSR